MVYVLLDGNNRSHMSRQMGEYVPNFPMHGNNMFHIDGDNWCRMFDLTEEKVPHVPSDGGNRCRMFYWMETTGAVCSIRWENRCHMFHWTETRSAAWHMKYL